MNREERIHLLKELRTHDVVGKFVILRPASIVYAEQIMELRNRPTNRYWFHQAYEITLEGQRKWFASYEMTENDIYWVVLDKEEKFIGTIRLYDIDLDGRVCTEGSYVIDENVAGDGPYAVEAKMLALDVAFSELQIESMINDNRADNKVINNIDNQLGYDHGTIIQVRGVDFQHRILYVKDYLSHREVLPGLIDYWSER